MSDNPLGIPMPPEELKRECTSRTCQGTMTGEWQTYSTDGKHKDKRIRWECRQCGRVEV